MSNVFITGANGLLGQHLVEVFSKEHKVLASDLHPDPFFAYPNIEYESLDILNKEKLKTIISSIKPELIVNTAAYTDVEGCEVNKEKAWEINVKGVENLIEFCQKEKIKLIHISTDYVFDGKNGPYSENDPPHPISYYGKSKLEGELKIKENGIDYIIVRTNVLYGLGEKINPNFFTWVLNKLKKDEKINVVTDQLNNPTLVDDLAKAILTLTQKKFTGIINIAGSEYLSRYDFARKIADKFDLKRDLIHPIKTEDLKQKAPRPKRGGLKVDLAKKILQTEFSDITLGLDHLKKELML
ncbi:MAG: dTDP-4-dehydrorhamnose reductase [Candidatus Zixiibacteriota bacterium]